MTIGNLVRHGTRTMERRDIPTVTDGTDETDGPFPHRRWWTAAIVLCVVLQVGTTLVPPKQIWSMPAGMACLAYLCAGITFVARPRRRGTLGRWRWWLVTAAFSFWATGWVLIAILPTIDGYQDYFLYALYIPRQILFLIVLLPTVEEDHGWLLRGLDLGQTLLLALAFGLLSWPPEATSSLIVGYLNVAFLCFALVSMVSLLPQWHAERRLLIALSIAFSTYAAASFITSWMLARYDVDRNSPIWVFGDTAYVLYGLFQLWAGQRSSPAFEKVRRRTSRHFPPLLLTAILLVMAIGASSRSMLGGAIVGIGSLLIYAIRTTILNDRYLAERDQLIATEAKRAHALIDIVHEVRSPLGSIVLNAALLARSSGLPQPQRKWVEQIDKGGTRVTTLLNDILDLERLDAGLVDADLTECNAHAVAADALAVVAGQARTFDVALELPPPGGERVIADRGKLERVLINLATNAIRFTPAGGHVAITVEPVDAARTAIVITDTGSGISAAGQAVLFERFGHVATPVNGTRGSGLGLSICRGLMTAMNGTLDISSQPGHGTRATVILPTAPPREQRM